MRHFAKFFALSTLALFGPGGCAGPEEDGEAVDQRDLVFETGCAPYAAQVGNLDFKKVGIITHNGVGNSVVEDPCRTTFNPTIWANNACTAQTQGKWSFWYLMSQAAGNRNVSEFILKTLESFDADQTVNGFTAPKRAGMRSLIIDPWRVLSGCASGKFYDQDQCQLKPEFAPFRLLAIVNRMDLRPGLPSGYSPADKDSAGEGRFVFGFLNNTGTPLAGTIILEYLLQTKTKHRVTWANQWLALNNKTWGNGADQFNPALQAITDGFVVKGVMPGKMNSGSALNTVRTDDRAFASKWALREFKLQCSGVCDTNAVLLRPAVLAMTPDNSHENSQTLYDFLNANAGSIRSGTHTVPLAVGNVPFQGIESISNPIINGSVLWGQDLGKFTEPELSKSFDTRRKFAIATCNGCHYFETDNGLNQHIINRTKTGEAKLSNFLDPSMQPWMVAPLFENLGELPHEFNEPKRRLCELVHTSKGVGPLLSNFFGG